MVRSEPTRGVLRVGIRGFPTGGSGARSVIPRVAPSPLDVFASLQPRTGGLIVTRGVSVREVRIGISRLRIAVMVAILALRAPTLPMLVLTP